MEHHELASLIPAMSGSDYAILKSNILSNGLMHPILLFEGKVLDGRHRLRACKELGIAPLTEEFRGDRDAALRRVFSDNVARRHLSNSEKREVNKRLKEMLGENTHGGGRNFKVSNDTLKSKAADRAEILAVSTATIKRWDAADKKEATPVAKAAKEGKPKKAGVSKRVAVKPALDNLPILEAKAADAGVTVAEVVRDLTQSALEAELALPDTFAPSAKAKFDSAMAAHRRKLDVEFEARVQAKVETWLEKTRIPMYEEKIAKAAKIEAAHKGVFTPEEYRKIVMTLHPDRKPTEDARTEVMALFTSKKTVLVADSVASSGKPLPSAAEIIAMKRKREGW